MGIDRMKHFLFSIATAIIENMNQMTRNKLIHIHSLFCVCTTRKSQQQQYKQFPNIHEPIRPKNNFEFQRFFCRRRKWMLLVMFACNVWTTNERERSTSLNESLEHTDDIFGMHINLNIFQFANTAAAAVAVAATAAVYNRVSCTYTRIPQWVAECAWCLCRRRHIYNSIAV